MFAALAEFERGLIIERTLAGMKAARARGVRPGPKPRLKTPMVDEKLTRQILSENSAREVETKLYAKPGNVGADFGRTT